LRGAPGNPVVALRAYREAMAAGDLALARSAVDALAGAAPGDATLLAIADAVRSGEWSAADAAADRLLGGPLDFLSPSIRAWVAFQRGGPAMASGANTGAGTALTRRFDAENAALLLIARGRADEGVAALRTLIGGGNDNVNVRIAAAELLASRGRRDTAADLLDGDDPVLDAVRARIGRGVRPSAAFGVSRLFVRLAGDVVDGEAAPLAIALCRAALAIDPAYDRATMTLAGALSNAGEQPRALRALAAIGPSSPYAASAAAMRITMLSRGGDTSAALTAAHAAASARGAGADDWQRYGDALMTADRFAEAADAYGTAIERSGTTGDWTLLLQRGGALEQAGRWQDAKPLLEQAVALAPREAHALNYLGYAQIERNENLAAARALLERAHALQPDDAAITDSLGWALVRTGAVRQALPLLEKAARAEPADVTIQEHLGDAYWSLGRRYEARYAWRAAAVYADDGEAARITGKLATGIAD